MPLEGPASELHGAGCKHCSETDAANLTLNSVLGSRSKQAHPVSESESLLEPHPLDPWKTQILAFQPLLLEEVTLEGD